MSWHLASLKRSTEPPNPNQVCPGPKLQAQTNSFHPTQSSHSQLPRTSRNLALKIATPALPSRTPNRIPRPTFNSRERQILRRNLEFQLHFRDTVRRIVDRCLQQRDVVIEDWRIINVRYGDIRRAVDGEGIAEAGLVVSLCSDNVGVLPVSLRDIVDGYVPASPAN
jgi:hypothetical protein